MNIKLPACYDVSHYEEIPDFSIVRPFPLLCITKATEGTYYKDDKFARFFDGMKQNHIMRGCYHFHKKAYGAETQARYFCDFISSYITGEDILILDVEEGGETAAQLQDWFRYVMNRFPYNPIMLYSRAGILDDILMTPTQSSFFKSIPIWTAGYPYNPDVYGTVPATYVPDQTQWGQVLLWQYSDKGKVEGIIGDVDLNWIHPILAAQLRMDWTDQPFDGVKRISGLRYGWKFEMIISDSAKVRYETVCTPSLETVSSTAKRKDAQIASNGGDWDRTALYDFAMSNGTICHERTEARPSLQISKDNIPIISHINQPNIWHALTGIRYLIRDGIIQSYLDDVIQSQYTEGHARSIHGLTADGKHILLVSEGKYPNQGLTLKQSAELMKGYGAVTAFDSGGGGDAEVVMNDNVLTITENISSTGLHFERPLPQIFLIYANGGSMSRYEAIALGDGTRLRPDHNTTGAYLSSWNKGTKFHGDDLFIASVDLKNDAGTVIQKTGDTWLQVTDVSGISKSGWVAISNMGVSICSLTDSNPPAPVPSHVVEVVIDGVSVFRKELY